MPRVADHSIDPQFIERWSPRAMSGQPLSEAEILSLFEAARWAPSCANQQPWRFVYGLAGTPQFQTLHDLLADGNKPWCARAGALVVVLSKKTFDNGGPLHTHSFDAGAAWMNVALQAHSKGLVSHGMAGFDYAKARTVLQVPEDHNVEAMIALGHPGSVEDLPENYRNRETPNGRKPVNEFVFVGGFPQTPPKE